QQHVWCACGRALKGQALVFKREQLGSTRANGGVFEANRHYFRAEQNSSHQAASDQSCKQVGHAFANIRAFHDAAKLLARRGAAIEFHPEPLRGREAVWKATMDVSRNRRIGYLVLSWLCTFEHRYSNAV